MKKSAYKIIAPKLKSAYQLDSGASSGPAILPNKQKSIFAITCNQNTNALREAIFYSSLEKAKLKLSKMAADRKHNLGVGCWEQDDLSFSFILGWEEVLVKFSIIEIKLDTE